MSRVHALAFASICLGVIAGCGEGGEVSHTTPSITSVTASCSAASINTNQTTTCTATVSGTGSYSSAVTWTVSPTSMGTVNSSGVFTPTAAGSATITATSAQDTTQAGSALVTVNMASTITSVMVSCSLSPVLPNQTSSCTASVSGTGSYSSAVTWSVSPSNLGTVSSSGVFTPTGLGIATVTATSAQDPTQSGSFAVELDAFPSITSVSVSCSPTSIDTTQSSQCTATVLGTGSYDASVTWSSNLGSIMYTGSFSSGTTGVATVTATSVQDPTQSGSTTVTVTYPPLAILSLYPTLAATGSASQSLTINGTGFLSNSTVTYNGIAHVATYSQSTVNSTTYLIIQLTASDQAKAGAFAVVVTNSIPGDQASASATFSVVDPLPSGQWTWMGGSQLTDQGGVYGTQGVAAAGNIPCARFGAVGWSDSQGNMWLFGGESYDASGSRPEQNDLWEFNPASNMWTWVSGSNSYSQHGVYGTLGVSDAANIPGGREGAVSWTDGNGKFWLFGGRGYALTGVAGEMNDLWQFDPKSNTWTWVSGSSATSQPGVYGTQGVADAANIPGGREGAVSWIDGSGNLWLFGGAGYDSAGTNGELNDLWEFSPTNQTWTWVTGGNLVNQPSVTGAQDDPGTPTPGGRNGAVSWIDGSGNLWLSDGFGEAGHIFLGNVGWLGDVWEFNLNTKTWNLVNGGAFCGEVGAQQISDQPDYGLRRVPQPLNDPGCSEGAVSWIDSTGKLWLFGGETYSSGFESSRNDLWVLDPTNGFWTWVTGNDTFGAPGVYGQLGVASANNVPGARWGVSRLERRQRQFLALRRQ
jgi:hypothetical protein